MRRKEKEIQAPREIAAVLEEADVLRIAFCDGDQPYIVPVSFGFEEGTIWFHSGFEGRKMDLLRKNQKCCFETETGVSLVNRGEPCNWGMHYRSVIGEGIAEIVENPDKKRHGLSLIVRHYGGDPSGIPEKAIEKVAVVRISITNLTGKSG